MAKGEAAEAGGSAARLSGTCWNDYERAASGPQSSMRRSRLDYSSNSSGKENVTTPFRRMSET